MQNSKVRLLNSVNGGSSDCKQSVDRDSELPEVDDRLTHIFNETRQQIEFDMYAEKQDCIYRLTTNELEYSTL